MKKTGKILVGLFSLAVVVFLLIQLVPYGKDHTNPPVTGEPAWDSPETRALAKRACFDCHSNETVYPWYSNVAPVSWLVMHDIEEGRGNLNFSEWETGSKWAQHAADEAGKAIQTGKMPLPIYVIQHPEARLTDAEKQALIKGLAASLK
ncbi:MAG: heme-binding domain-containing protein [Leptolinea sp.]|jgi:mono/diheme cytochrome c family protein|nr:heme-binding domain-containing protein [Leptolinea sp.]